MLEERKAVGYRDDLINVRIVRKYALCASKNQRVQPRLRPRPAKGANQGGGKQDITDAASCDNQYSSRRFHKY